jgi:hypothetical protein
MVGCVTCVCQSSVLPILRRAGRRDLSPRWPGPPRSAPPPSSSTDSRSKHDPKPPSLTSASRACRLQPGDEANVARSCLGVTTATEAAAKSVGFRVTR